MPVFDAGVDPYVRVVLHDALEVPDELPRLGRRDVARRIVIHKQAFVALGQAHQVDPEGGVVFIEGHPDARGLYGGPAGVVSARVDPEHRHVRHVASRGEPRFHGAGHAQLPPGRQGVHERGAGDLQGGFPPEFHDGLVSHAVAEKKCQIDRISAIYFSIMLYKIKITFLAY